MWWQLEGDTSGTSSCSSKAGAAPMPTAPSNAPGLLRKRRHVVSQSFQSNEASSRQTEAGAVGLRAATPSTEAAPGCPTPTPLPPPQPLHARGTDNKAPLASEHAMRGSRRGLVRGARPANLALGAPDHLQASCHRETLWACASMALLQQVASRRYAWTAARLHLGSLRRAPLQMRVDFLASALVLPPRSPRCARHRLTTPLHSLQSQFVV